MDPAGDSSCPMLMWSKKDVMYLVVGVCRVMPLKANVWRHYVYVKDSLGVSVRR